MSSTLHGVLLDIDGVLKFRSRPIDGAPEALRRLREIGHPVQLVTNTTSRSRAVLATELRGMGFELEDEEILNPMVAASAWIRQNDRGPVALFVPDSSREDFDGVDRLDDDAETGARTVVLGDLREGWTWETMNRVLRLLLDEPDCALVALGRTRYWKGEDGFALDVGPFAAMFEMATDRDAVVLGKPAVPFFELACRSIDRRPERVVMVGDDIRSDVGGALNAGLDAVLVRTGKFREEDLRESIRPTAVLDSVADLPDHLR